MYSKVLQPNLYTKGIKFKFTVDLINLKVRLPEYKLNFANLEFRISPNTAQIYAT